MKRFNIERPSPALVLAFVALFAALVGGAYAAKAVKKNTVVTKSIKKNAVTGPKIKAGAVTLAKLGGDVSSSFYTYGGKIPSGKTVKGAWGCASSQVIVLGTCSGFVSLPAEAPQTLGAAEVNFSANSVPPLAAASDADAACTGSVANPTAPAGKVCLYTGGATQNDTGSGTGIGGGTASNNSGVGFSFSITDAAANPAGANGSWAYTAP